MRHYSFLLLLLPLLLACHPDVPKDILPTAKMQSTMWDMMRADEMASYYVQHDSSINLLNRRAQYYGEVFRVHNLTEADFKRSLDFYENHPDIFKTVLDSLQSMGERLQKTADTSHKTATPPPSYPSGSSPIISAPADSLKIKARRLHKSIGRRKKLTVQ